MPLGALVADANGRPRGERCGLPPTWLNVTACDWLENARCRLSGHGTRDENIPALGTQSLCHTLLLPAVDSTRRPSEHQ